MERTPGLGFVGEGTSTGGESCTEYREWAGCAMKEGSKTLDIEGWEWRLSVKGVEEGVPCSKW